MPPQFIRVEALNGPHIIPVSRIAMIRPDSEGFTTIFIDPPLEQPDDEDGDPPIRHIRVSDDIGNLAYRLRAIPGSGKTQLNEVASDDDGS